MKSNHYAVVVGIDHYPGIPNRPLRYARNDALAFHEWLTTPGEGGLPEDNAMKLLATDLEQASGKKRPLRTEFIDLLRQIQEKVDGVAESEWNDSRLYIYLAGHGVAPYDARGALLFADAYPDDHFYGDMFDLDACLRFYERCRYFEEIVLFGDFCRDVDQGIPAVGEMSFSKCFTKFRTTRRVIGYATSIAQEAREPKAPAEVPANAPPLPGSSPKYTAEGFFTRALLEGLRGEADPHPIYGTVDIGQVQKYVTDRVATLSASRQVPDIFSTDWGLVLARREIPRYPVNLLVPEGFAEPIKLMLLGYEVPDRWEPGDPLRWTVHLPVGGYEVVTASGEAVFKNDSFFRVNGARDVEL
jgi:Caspase domain